MLNNVKAMEMNENELVNANGGAWYNDVIDWCGDRVDDVTDWFSDTYNEGMTGKIIAISGAAVFSAAALTTAAVGAVTAGPLIVAAAGIGAFIGGAVMVQDATNREKQNKQKK
ncbi:MAG: hypothetical protein CW338_11430 [Clostridiales bacterium]|nr:hypothetical protein [Clostridiales bacterium]